MTHDLLMLLIGAGAAFVAIALIVGHALCRASAAPFESGTCPVCGRVKEIRHPRGQVSPAPPPPRERRQ